MNYREMTPEEIQQSIDEREAYRRWEKAKNFAQHLYGPNAKKMWMDVNSKYVHGVVVYGPDGKPLQHSFDAPFWSEPFATGSSLKTWREFLEYCYEKDCEKAGSRDVPTKQATAFRILLGVYSLELGDCLRPDKDYDQEDKLNPENRIIDYDFDQPPVLSFPKVYIPVE